MRQFSFVALLSGRSGIYWSWVCSAVIERMSCAMDNIRFDETDYSVVVKNRADPPNPWRWEIYRAGRSSAIEQSPIFFRTMAATNKAGKAALKQLLGKLKA
jgi:hypothetical protein